MRLIALTLLSLALLGPASAAPLTADDLGGPDRYLTHLATDKPIYRPGETLYARGVVLNAFTRRPLADVPWTTVEILGPKGDVVAQEGASGSDGVIPFTWSIPEGQPGGTYTLRMSGGGRAPGERGFEIRAFRAPRIKTQIVFLRDGYGPGDEVTATLSATRAEGGVPAGARVTLVARVDGAEVARQDAGTIDAAGRVSASFRLPKKIERGDGTLALVVEDGGIVETATKTIPILVNVVDLWIYPEGGDLVAGVPTRVYFEARTPNDKPADIAGQIETTGGRVVAALRTEHEGRGRVRITPVAGERYVLRITEPSGIATRYNLPGVRTSGAVISSFDDVAAAGEPLRLRAGAAEAGEYQVTVSVREKQVAARRIALGAQELRRLALELPDDASGVLRVTLTDDDGKPLSERLIFRKPAHDVHVAVSLDRERYVPAGTVALTVRTTRDDGTPIPATVGLCVSDDAVRELLETRDQPPQLPVQVLIEDEVRELADAAVYLNPADAKAPRAMDLLLGTQGWRRFVFASDPGPFLHEHGDQALRVLAMAEPEAVGMLADDRAAAGGIEEVAFAVAVPPMAQDKPAAPAPAEVEAKKQIAADRLEKDEGRLAMNAVEGGLARRIKAPGIVAQERQRAAFVPVREYAHAVRGGRKPGDRADFTDTVYWNAGVRTDANGSARVTFALSDAVTSFRVLADAFTDSGALGAASRLLDSVEPFYLEPKLPLEITYGDVVRLPVTAVNGTLERLTGVSLVATATGGLSAGTLPAISLGEGDRVRSLLELRAMQQAGLAELTITGTAGDYRDAVTRSLRVVPLGFPVKRSFGGLLAPGARAAHDLVIPGDAVTASVRLDVKVFPSSLGKLTGALERLIQEPYGCFEQTSSTTYPLVMAAQYFESHQGVDPALITRSRELLGKGYERLTGFETKTKGYEWFGESPGHEALSAFGLLEFTDMSRVRSVDPAMLQRTREWVLSTRDGKGGFRRERRALHTWIEDEACSNAYIAWALLEGGEPASNLTTEIDALAKTARASSNTYVVALAANVMQLAGRKDDAAAFLQSLASHQASGGLLDGATASIVGSSGEALQIEATALATLAWLRSPAHSANVEKAIRALSESCEGGRYGSTQSTVLALRAIVEHDTQRSRPRAAGSVTLLIDGKPAGAAIAFDERTDGAITFPDAGAMLTPGPHRIELAMDGGAEMPYAIEASLSRLTPESSKDCPLSLSIELNDDRFVEGEIGEATAVVSSRSTEPTPMAVVIVGLPGGVEPRHEQLKELVKAGRIAAYEVTGREVVLYFRSLAAGAQERIPLSFVAVVPGTYTGPASRAYLYYGDEHKAWAPGFRVDIAAR